MSDSRYVNSQPKLVLQGPVTLKAFIAIAFSFMMAFFMQLVVHELGHYIMGLLMGATGGHVILHPFANSKVIFTDYPGLTAEIMIGISGIVFDLVVAVTLGIIFWQKKSILWLPIMMWGSIACIGEGIGMLSSLPMYPQSIEDITQLMRIGVPGSLIAVVSFLLVLTGLIWMILILPMAGVTSETGLIKRFVAYMCSLPLYFAVAVLFLKSFQSSELDMISIRLLQMTISIGLAVVMTFTHRVVFRILERKIKQGYIPEFIFKVPGNAKWSDVLILAVVTGAMVSGLLFYGANFS